MLLRALQNLNIGVRRGELFSSERISERARSILVARGIIAPVNSPPMAAIEGWESRAETLARAGVLTLGDLVLTETIDGVEPADLQLWQDEAKAILTVSKKCCGGR